MKVIQYIFICVYAVVSSGLFFSNDILFMFVLSSPFIPILILSYENPQLVHVNHVSKKKLLCMFFYATLSFQESNNCRLVKTADRNESDRISI
jgi:hypothetical protein